MSTFIVVSVLLLSSVFAVEARPASTSIQLTKTHYPEARIYTGTWFQGESTVLALSGNCTSLREFPLFDKNISSIIVARPQRTAFQSFDKCVQQVRLYKTYNCSGTFFSLMANKGFDLGEWKAETSSIVVHVQCPLEINFRNSGHYSALDFKDLLFVQVQKRTTIRAKLTSVGPTVVPHPGKTPWEHAKTVATWIWGFIMLLGVLVSYCIRCGCCNSDGIN